MPADPSAPGGAPSRPPAPRPASGPPSRGRSPLQGRRRSPSRGGSTAARRVACAVAAAAFGLAGCWRIGEPTPDDAAVTWAAYPETVRVGRVFSLEYAGPVSRNSCGRLDTSRVTVSDTAVLLSARRSLYDTSCPGDRVSFYEARPTTVESPGRYPVRTAGGRRLGTLVAVETGPFSGMVTVGEGTVREGGGCLFFGPGWASNQRPFALEGAPERLRRVAGTDTVVWIRGDLLGFTLCQAFGSRPRILVDSARVTGREASTYYYGTETEHAAREGPQ